MTMPNNQSFSKLDKADTRLRRDTDWQDLPKADPDPLKAECPAQRLRESGPGSELVRRIFAEELRGHFETFLLVAETLEIITLFEVFEFQQQQLPNSRTLPSHSSFVEAFLTMLGLDPTALLDAQIQRRPIRRGI